MTTNTLSMRMRLRPTSVAASFGLAWIVASVVYLCVGGYSFSLRELWSASMHTDNENQAATILFYIRLPRLLLATLVGALLASSGAAMQGLFRNPLADPSLIGVTAGASAGGSLVIALTAGWLSGAMSLWVVSAGAFVGGAVCVGLVYKLSSSKRFHGTTSVTTLLLAGIALTALASGVTNLLEFFADNALLRRISLWKMGGLESATWPRVAVVALLSIAMLVLLPRYAIALNSLLLGEAQARYLGISVESVKRALILLVAAAVGGCVAMAGAIAFVGLVVPHIVRLLVGPDHRYVLPLSALAGALLLVVADLLARIVVLPAELPVGLITVFIGAPFFIYLLSRGRYRAEGG